MKIKTDELLGTTLDWAVARCECGDGIDSIDDPHFYSTDWSIGGPIIEQKGFGLRLDATGEWWASTKGTRDVKGPTPLIAAMRLYVYTTLGYEINVHEKAEMNEPLKPLPASGRCCGKELMLAHDHTEYSTVELISGKWQQTYSHQEPSDAWDSVRLLCAACGDYFEVPEDLP